MLFHNFIFILELCEVKMENNMSQDSLRQYFQKALVFLKNQQWIYNYPNTHILVYKILDEFDPEWVSYFKNITNDELNDLAFCIVNVSF